MMMEVMHLLLLVLVLVKHVVQLLSVSVVLLDIIYLQLHVLLVVVIAFNVQIPQEHAHNAQQDTPIHQQTIVVG